MAALLPGREEGVLRFVARNDENATMKGTFEVPLRNDVVRGAVAAAVSKMRRVCESAADADADADEARQACGASRRAAS